MTRQDLLKWLGETDARRLEDLWRQAHAVRLAEVGDEVHLRGLIEISNHCARSCGYCGIRSANRQLERYRMTADEILAAADWAVRLGYGTVVLQAGEDGGITADWMTDVIRAIKDRTALAVTLSLGERTPDELAQWREAGADRYLLRFETSNRELFDRIHPPRPGRPCDRLALLETLKAIGYETGSGVMIGIPGQSYEDLARDIELFGKLDLDMIGVGPFIPHPDTPLGENPAKTSPAADFQVPNSEELTYKVVALTRLTCPRANIPSTTALATLNSESGRENGLIRGANVIMPNLTPARYRRLYEIYPNKACFHEEIEAYDAQVKRSIAALGQRVGQGRGDSLNYRSRHVKREPTT